MKEGAKNIESSERDAIVVGAIYPLSGEHAPVGRSIRQALELALHHVNQRNGFPLLGNRRIRLLWRDSKGDPAIGEKAAKELIRQEKVTALIGAYQTSVTATASRVAEAYHIPFVNPESSAPSLTERNFQWFFRTGPDDRLFTRLFFELFQSLRKRGHTISRFAIVSEDSPFGREASQVEIEYIRRFQGELVSFEMYGPSVNRFVPMLKRVRQAHPHAVFGQQFLADAIRMINALKTIGWYPNGFTVQNAGYVVPEFIEHVAQNGNYVISRAAWALGLEKQNPRVKVINQQYRDLFGEDMNETNARSFTGLIVLADAIHRAESTAPGSIRWALRQTRLPGNQLIMPWRGVQFNKSGQNQWANGLLVQLLNQRYRIIWPPALAETQVIWPAPSWNERGK